MKDFAKSIRTGNAFDFETQAVVDRKEAVKKAEEALRKAEAERNRHRGELYWEEAFITAKKDLERAKENLERAQRQKAGNSKVGNAVFSYEDKARIAKQRYLEAKANKDYPEGVKYEERMAKDHINHLNEILQKIKSGKMDPRYEADEKDVEKAISIYKQIGNSKVGNYIMNVMDQANEYSKGFSEALKKGDKAEAEKVSGYAKILKRQIKEEREEIQKRLKDLDNAERIMGAVGNRKIGNSSKFDALESIIQEASMYAENAYRRLNSPYSATNIISDLSHCKQACDVAIKRAQEYDKELQAKK